jgi:hypothetical protein
MMNDEHNPVAENLMEKWKLPLLTDYIKKWAAITPDNPALVSADTGKAIPTKSLTR